MDSLLTYNAREFNFLELARQINFRLSINPCIDETMSL